MWVKYSLFDSDMIKAVVKRQPGRSNLISRQNPSFCWQDVLGGGGGHTPNTLSSKGSGCDLRTSKVNCWVIPCQFIQKIWILTSKNPRFQISIFNSFGLMGSYICQGRFVHKMHGSCALWKSWKTLHLNSCSGNHLIDKSWNELKSKLKTWKTLEN
jgi:hypothetical protein